MTRDENNKSVNGRENIIFKQNLEYPRVPGQISYYPSEPSEDLRKQVKKDKGGGISLYIVGFVITLIGYIGAREFSNSIDIYSVLIPLLLVIGLVFAIMYLFMNNIALAKLSRVMPLILMICLILFYITSIITSIISIAELADGAPDGAFSNAFGDLMDSLLNPAFFIMSAGLLVCRAGGTMLWTSTKVMNQYIPGMIIIESPVTSPRQTAPQGQPIQEPEVHAPDEETKVCEHCNKPLEFIEEYGRYYCYDCQEYAPKDI